MKKKNNVIFTYLDVYLFGRCLGGDKVPETGNNPLGMDNYHFSLTRVDIHKKSLNDVDIADDVVITPTPHTSTDFVKLERRRSEDCDSVYSIDYTSKTLQPLNPRQRIKCLKDAGVELVKDQLSVDEGKYLLKLRQERQQVGCKCTGNRPCDPKKCACSKEGISCQSDGHSFPCKCGPKCSNQNGKRVYSDLRIKYHYMHVFERDLFEELSPYSLSMITQYGDCQICNDMNDVALKSLFPVHNTPKRKRTAVVHPDVATKLQKLPIIKSVPMESVPEDNAPVYAPLHTSPFVAPQPPSAIVSQGKENVASHVSFTSPIVVESAIHNGRTHPPSSRFNDSWSNIDSSLTPSPIIISNTYWDSFLNSTAALPRSSVSPMQLAVASLNPISLTSEYCAQSSRNTAVIADNAYKSRHRSGLSKVAYFESPCDKTKRKMKSLRLNLKKLKPVIESVTMNREATLVVDIVREEEEGQEGEDNMAMVSFLAHDQDIYVSNMGDKMCMTESSYSLVE